MLCIAMIASGQHANGSTEKAIAALESQWAHSQAINDPGLIGPLLADKFVYTGNDGTVSDKAAVLADWKATRWTSVVYSDEKVVIFGDTAIATGESRGKGIDSAGKPMDYHDRFTDVWVKMPDGRWQCVSSQDSSVTK